MNDKDLIPAPGKGVTSSDLFGVGLRDTHGDICWLAGYGSDPTRYYDIRLALRFRTQLEAKSAIARAKKTHPLRERKYEILPLPNPQAEVRGSDETC